MCNAGNQDFGSDAVMIMTRFGVRPGESVANRECRKGSL